MFQLDQKLIVYQGVKIHFIELIYLEYFIAIQDCVIDTMHKLFLGTPKHNVVTFGWKIIFLLQI